MIHAKAFLSVITQHAAHHARAEVIANRRLYHAIRRNAARRQEVRTIGRIIDQQRYCHEENKAGKQRYKRPDQTFLADQQQVLVADLSRCTLCIAVFLESAPNAPEEQHRKANARVAARPFAGNGKAHKQA